MSSRPKASYERLKRLTTCQTSQPRLAQLNAALGLRKVKIATIPLMTPIFDRSELTNLSTDAA